MSTMTHSKNQNYHSLRSVNGMNDDVRYGDQIKYPTAGITKTEMKLMELRKLQSEILDCGGQTETRRKKLHRSDAIRKLKLRLQDYDLEVRRYALSLLCGAVPRLGDRTDQLLQPLLPRVIGYLGSEWKDVATQAVRFLRVYLRHCDDKQSFIDLFIREGIRNPDPMVRRTSYNALSVLFDHPNKERKILALLVPVILKRMELESPLIQYSIFYALNKIQKLTGEEQFCSFMKKCNSSAYHIWVASSAPKRKSNASCAQIIAQYQETRMGLGLGVDYGILHPGLLEDMKHAEDITTKCDAINRLSNFIKKSDWEEMDLEPHIVDFLSLINCLLADNHRMVQTSALEIHKGLVERMGLGLAPHLEQILKGLSGLLSCVNPRLKNRATHCLRKLMVQVHPMTVALVTLEVMGKAKGSDAYMQEEALRQLTSALKSYPYYDYDLMVLCEAVGHFLEEEEGGVRRAAEKCFSQLLHVMDGAPVDGLRGRAVYSLVENNPKKVVVDALDIRLPLEDSRYTSSASSSEGRLALKFEESSTSTLTEDNQSHQEGSVMDESGNEKRSSRKKWPPAIQMNLPLPMMLFDGDDDNRDETRCLQSDIALCSDVSVAKCIGRPSSSHSGYAPRSRSWKVSPRPSPPTLVKVKPAISFVIDMEDRFLPDIERPKCMKSYPEMKMKCRQGTERERNFQEVDENIEYQNVSFVENHQDDQVEGREQIAACRDGAGDRKDVGDEAMDEELRFKRKTRKEQSSPRVTEQALNPKYHNFNILQVDSKDYPVTSDEAESEYEPSKIYMPYLLEKPEKEHNNVATVQENCTLLTEKENMQLASNSSKTTVYENHFLSPEKPNDFFKIERDILSKTVCSDSSPTTEHSSEEIEYENPVAETDNENDNLSHAVCRNSPINETEIKSFNSVAERSSTGSISDHAIESEENTSMSSSKHSDILSPDDVTNTGKLSNESEAEHSSSTSASSDYSNNKSSIIEIDIEGRIEDSFKLERSCCEQPSNDIEVVNAGHKSSHTELDTEESIPDLSVPEQKFSSGTSLLDIAIDNDNEDSVPDLSMPEKIDCPSPSYKNYNSESGIPITETDSVHDLSLDYNAGDSPSKSGLTANEGKCIKQGLILRHANGNPREELRKVEAVHRAKVCSSEGFDVDLSKDFRMFCEDHLSRGPIVSLERQESMKDCVTDDTQSGASLKDKGKTSAAATWVSKKKTASKGAGKPSVGPAEGKKNSEKTDKEQKPKKNFVQMNSKAFIRHSPDSVKTSVAVDPKVVEARKRWSGSTSTKSLVKSTDDSVGGFISMDSRPKHRKVSEMVNGPRRLGSPRPDFSFREESTPEPKRASNQWKRELDYTVKGGTCPWATAFNREIKKMAAFSCEETADSEVKKALDALNGTQWMEKEEAMVTVMRAFRFHGQVAREHLHKVVLALLAEMKSLRQSVAGKAVLTLGFMHAALPKEMENKLRLVIDALLNRAGNRTMAAGYRLVIRTLGNILKVSAQHKAALALAAEGTRHANKASRETAAQFLASLVETLGPVKSLNPNMAPSMLRSAAVFALDGSPLTRHCGKFMFSVMQQNPNFRQLRNRHIESSNLRSLKKLLDQIKCKGVAKEKLPIYEVKMSDSDEEKISDEDSKLQTVDAK